LFLKCILFGSKLYGPVTWGNVGEEKVEVSVIFAVCGEELQYLTHQWMW